MDVAGQPIDVIFILHQHIFKPSLEEMAAPVVLDIVPAGIGGAELLHAPGKVGLALLRRRW
jgi:hypothetical protein